MTEPPAGRTCSGAGGSTHAQPPDPSPPGWLAELCSKLLAAEWSFRAVDDRGRRSAVLMLFGEGPDGGDLLLTERATGLRAHAGQPAFPGGTADPADAGPAATALREAWEEVGVDPAGVQVLGELPALTLSVTGYAVVPVLGWWRAPVTVGVMDSREVAAVLRVPLAGLADPANRCRVRHPSGQVGPAFVVGDLLVWGFTAMLIDRVLEIGGLRRPWEPAPVCEPPAASRHAGRPA